MISHRLQTHCCTYCDYLTCEYNGKKRKKKSQPHRCPYYHQEVKSKSFKTHQKNRLKRIYQEEY